MGELIRRRLSPKWVMLATAVSLGIVTVGGVMVAGARSAQAPDPGELRAATERAIVTYDTAPTVPEGMRPGHLSLADRQALRAHINQQFMQSFAGPALTNSLNGFLAWADRVAKDPTQPRVLSYKLVDLALDPPTVTDDVATVTGTYSVTIKQGYDTPGGVTATYGGTFSDAITVQLERRNGGWLVTAFNEQPTGFERDPSFESNLNINPAPGATKPPHGDLPPVPVNPAVP